MAILKTVVDYFWVVFGSGFARGLALVNTLIIARMIGPTAYGTFSIFYTIMILTWQIPGAVDALFVSYAKKELLPEKKKELLKTTVFLKFCYLVGTVLFAYPLSYFLAIYCFQKNDAIITIFTAFMCGVALNFLMTIASIFQEQGRYALFAITNAIYTGLIFIGLIFIYFVIERFTLSTVLRLYLVVSVSVGCICIFSLIKKAGNFFIPNRELLNKYLSQGKWLVASVITGRIFMRIDILLLARFVDLKSLGIYSVAAQVIQVIYLATGALSGISLPKASEAIKSKNNLYRFTRESLWLVILINVGILLFFVIAPFLINILYGVDYRYAGTIVRILLIGWIFNIFFIPFSFIFIAISDTKSRFLLEFLKMLIGLSLLGVLLPKFGIDGAAYAITLSLILSMFISTSVLYYKLKKRIINSGS